MQVRGNKDGQKLGALGAGGEYKEYKLNSEQVVNVQKNGIKDAFSTADILDCPRHAPDDAPDMPQMMP